MTSELNPLIANSLFREPSSNGLFNPYASRVDGLDRPDAIEIRRENLLSYCEYRSGNPSVLLLAEAPGPWGCRFSGVPITSESQLLDPNFHISGRQSSIREEPYTEYSAGIYWRILAPWHDHIFTWNTVPLHPHHPGKPLTIRTPRVGEIKRFLPLTGEIIRILAPRSILAVGRKAERALNELETEYQYVRHPSQGGAPEFEAGVRAAMNDLGLEPAPDVGPVRRP